MEQIRIVAPNLQEAMAQVKARLGADATIISWNNLGDAIEVIAAGTPRQIQRPEIQENYSAAEFNSLEGSPQKHKFDHIAPLEEFRTSGGTAPRYDIFAYEEELKQREIAKRKQAFKASGNKNAKNNAKRGIGALLQTNDGEKTASATSIKTVKIKVSENKISNDAETHQQKSSTNKERSPLHPLLPLLVKAGLDLKEIKPFAAYFKYESATKPLDLLIKILEDKYEYDPLPAIPEHPIILIGSAGSGKTATAAKIAARAISAGAEVLLISTDTERQGGIEQLKGFAQKLGASFNFADNISEAEHLVRSGLDAGKVVIVDNGSSSFIEPAEMRVLERLINETKTEPLLCLPADLRSDDVEDMLAAFKGLEVKRCILTRTDLTNRRAGPLKGLLVNPLKISLISASPFIAGGIVMANPQRLAGLILDPFNNLTN